MNRTQELKKVIGSDKILPSASDNLKKWLDAEFLPQWALNSLSKLINQNAWDEINDRFYKSLEFGTGGMRGRTIGRIITSDEKGEPNEYDTPKHPGVGCSYFNDFNVVRATIGLYRYCSYSCKDNERPKLVIAHDVRHFSRHFCLLAASTWINLGGIACIFNGPRSTPQLSFSVRYLKAKVGIVITASHNPSHDNGYKVYYGDGGQVVSPNADGIINEVNRVELSEIPSYLQVDETEIQVLKPEADEAYLSVVKSTVIDAALIRSQKPKVVFTPIHGAGQVSSLSLMKSFDVDYFVVKEQMVMDPRFSTVDSPNPEYAEALSMAIDQAEQCGADLVLATDPDGDRMGAAARDNSGKMNLLNGNCIGSLLAEYRITKLKELGWIPREGTLSAALVKTFVTTPLQEAIAKSHGLKIINTLTGFKWIGEKLLNYETELKIKLEEIEGKVVDYDKMDYRDRSNLLLKYSTFYVFGGEESYGYLATDAVRDKDANAAVILFCELAAYLKEQGLTFFDYLDSLYVKYGYFKETLLSIYYEGAIGAQKIKAILKSYRSNPPKSFNGVSVSKITNFGRERVHDADGKRIPMQDFYFIQLDDGYRYAVRASGTEPKIKFYIFGQDNVESSDQLASIKEKAKMKIAALKKAIESDAHERAEG